MHNQIMLEVYCMRDESPDVKDFGIQCDGEPKYKCLENNCPFLTFTSYENCLCYVNQDSVCEKSIALGNDESKAVLNLWKDISFKKIDEAYDALAKKTKTNKIL